MINDPISDFLARIKNAYLSHYKTVEAPYIRILSDLAKILEKEGFIEKFEIKDGEKNRKTIIVTLRYNNRKPAITEVKRVSKPGLRVYVSKQHIPVILGGLGTVVISTSQGLMSGKDAKQKSIGGELLCKVW